MVGQLRAQLDSQEFRLESRGFARNGGQDLTADISLPKRGPKRRRPKAPETLLACTVEAEIIPRLLLNLRRNADRAGEPGAEGAGEVATFARIVLSGDIGVACDYVEMLRGRGLSLESIYVDVIEPSARKLGDLWNADACDFVSVTVGVLRLQQILHEFGLAFRREVEPREHGHRALLVPAPGDKGTFGHLMFGTFELALAAEFLRRDGWDACVDSSASGNDAVRMVRNEWFDVIELSLSSESRLRELTTGIRLIRRASRNRALGIVVGGPVFKEHPEMVVRVGADLAASDGRQAALQADNLMALLRSR